MEDTFELICDIQDYLFPRLDVYEQAIYFYSFRHSRLVGKDDVVIGFKSARRRLAMGVGEKGKPMADNTAYEKLRSLEQKGCIKIVDSVRQGSKIRVLLPREIPGIIPAKQAEVVASLEEQDFFTVEMNREAILKREGNQCFYCLKNIDRENYVIEHIVSRPDGNNSYRNLVAACRSCNNRKGDVGAEGHLRILYRDGLLSNDEFMARRIALDEVLSGRLKPQPARGDVLGCLPLDSRIGDHEGDS